MTDNLMQLTQTNQIDYISIIKIVKMSFLFHSDNSTDSIEDEVAKVILRLVEDESHKFMRPHAGGKAVKYMNSSRSLLVH